MTLNEFKSWLDGFSHYFDEPSAEQWQLIKDKLDTITIPPSITLGSGSGSLSAPPWQVLCCNPIASSKI